jgi:hypothetical protein
MQIPGLLQIEAECHQGALAKRIGPISDDTLGYALQRQSPEAVFGLSCEIARRLKRNGVLLSNWSRGLVIAAVDGIEICSSSTRCCDACIEREVQHKVQGEMRIDLQYYHRIVVVALASTPFPIPLGVRFQKNGEGEVPCALTQESTNFYATNFELGSISPLFIHQFSCSRWRIDTELFQTITTDCHLKHPAVHQTTALVVLTMIRFLAYTLSLVFYHRQVRSHARGSCETFHQLAKRLANWFIATTANTS